MQIQRGVSTTAPSTVPRRFFTEVSSASTASKEAGVAEGLVTNSEEGRKENFESIPSSFQTVTSCPSD